MFGLGSKNMNWTEQDLTRLGYYQHFDGNYYPHPPNPHRIPDPVTKRPAQQTLVALPQAQKGSKGRTNIVITRYSCRPLDIDNFAGGCKPIIDELRYAKLIAEDNPETIDVEFKQVKVSQKNQQRTEIQISY
jgi:hypothetical protein